MSRQHNAALGSVDQELLSRYQEKLVKIGDWVLLRREDNRIGNYRVMIGHQCPARLRFYVTNGEYNQPCSACKQPVPDEIQGLWTLCCNDQRRGWDNGR